MFSKSLYNLGSFMCCSIILFHLTFEVDGQARDVCASDITVLATQQRSSNPKIATAHEVMEEGMNRFNAGNYRESIKCWTLLIDSVPQLRAVGLKRRAECHEKLGDVVAQTNDLNMLNDIRLAQRYENDQRQYGPAPRRPLRIRCDDLD